MGGCLSSEGGRRRKVGREGSGGLGGSGRGEFGLLSKYGSFGEDELHRIPGRMFLNGASDVACLYTQQGKKGTNQDAMLVWEDFASREDTIFCGVFDGHGPFGHMVSKKVRDSLPLKLLYGWRPNLGEDKISTENNNGKGCMVSEEIALDGDWAEVWDVEESDKFPEMYLTLRKLLLKAFRLMDKELKLHPVVDSFCSGTTAVTLVKQGQDLVIANVGDSRAVLGTRDKDNSLIAAQLTEDLKPNLPREAARIQQCKGRVFALQDEPEVARVWLPNCDSPGLAMARAFGDFCLKDFGLISVPDICYHHLTPKDEFVVLATDGVWDVLSNQEVVDIVASVPSRHTAARALVDCAVRAWTLKFPTSKVDDCAVVCLFIDPASDTSHESNLETPKDDAVSQVSDSIDVETVDERTVKPAVSRSLAPQLSDPKEITADAEVRNPQVPERCSSTRSLAECVFSSEEEWSALEGVTRVNSLVNLPRFGPVDKRPGSWRKWL